MQNFEPTIFGTGKPILFLPGWQRTKSDFRNLFFAPPPFQGVFIDLPGFGQAPLDEKVTTPSEYASWVNAMCKNQQIDPVAIVGHSFGGKVAFCLRKHFPNAQLVLIAPSLVRPKRRIKVIIRKLVHRIKKGFGKSGRGSADYEATSGHLRKVLLAAVNTYYDRELKHFNGELHLIWGDLDQATPLNQAYRIKRRVKRCQLTIIPGGHFAFQPHRYQLIKLLREISK